MTKRLPPTPALLRNWKKKLDYWEGKDFSKAKYYREKIDNSPLQEVEMSDGRNTLMWEGNY